MPACPVSSLNVHNIPLTLEEILILGKTLDSHPEQPSEIEDVLDGIYDKVDPILTEAYGEYWSDQ